MSNSTTLLCLIINYFFGLDKQPEITNSDEFQKYIRRNEIFEKLSYLIYLAQERGFDMGYHYEISQNQPYGYYLYSPGLLIDWQALWSADIPPWPQKELIPEIKKWLELILPYAKIKLDDLPITDSIKYFALAHYLKKYSKYDMTRIMVTLNNGLGNSPITYPVYEEIQRLINKFNHKNT